MYGLGAKPQVEVVKKTGPHEQCVVDGYVTDNNSLEGDPLDYNKMREENNTFLYSIDELHSIETPIYIQNNRTKGNKKSVKGRRIMYTEGRK